VENDYNLGIGVIDEQHKRIVDYINDLDDAIHMTGNERHVRLLDVLNEVVNYTESHFSFEEAMLEDVKYPFILAHKKVHELFIRRLNDYIQRFAKGEDVVTELRNTLARWLINHIKSEVRTTPGAFAKRNRNCLMSLCSRNRMMPKQPVFGSVCLDVAIKNDYETKA
jgi:hemerythrin